MTTRTIGVFDSGVGGLTVLAALQKQMPGHTYLYLGDTARLPYGTKSERTITRYALRAARHLIAQNIDLLVVACNTASAQALPALREAYPDLPIFGVIEPAALLAAELSRSGRIAVLSTEGTARTGAYVRAIHARRADAHITSTACALLVAIAEEGWHEGPIAHAITHRYLAPLFAEAASAPDTIVLGCTHFPLLAATIRDVVGGSVIVIESGSALAAGLTCVFPDAHTQEGSSIFQVTDSPDRFLQVAERFLGHRISPKSIHLVEL